MTKIIVPLIIFTVAIIGVGTASVLAPQPQLLQVNASSIQEYTATFKTIDGDIIAEIETVDGRVPIEFIPNAPQIQYRPFLRWTNVQGFALDGIITQDVAFLPLYSYDPQWQGDGSHNQDGSKPYKKTQWLFMNYILDENTILFSGLIGFGVVLFLLFLFLVLLKGVLK